MELREWWNRDNSKKGATLTWCKAVRPSTFPVLMSAPFWRRRMTSSLSPAAHAARNTQSAENLIFRATWRGWAGSRFVSDCSHRLSCSARLKRAELDLVSRDIAPKSRRNHSVTYNHFAIVSSLHTSEVSEPRETTSIHWARFPSLKRRSAALWPHIRVPGWTPFPAWKFLRENRTGGLLWRERSPVRLYDG